MTTYVFRNEKGEKLMVLHDKEKAWRMLLDLDTAIRKKSHGRRKRAPVHLYHEPKTGHSHRAITCAKGCSKRRPAHA